MKEWTQKNKGQPLYKMFTGNEYAFTMFVLMNFKGPWKQAWDYHLENNDVPKAEKDKFAKYSVMTKEDAEEGGQDEVAMWEKYMIVKPRFTNTKKARCRESVTDEGMAFYYRHYTLWKEFFKLDETDERRVKFDEVWDQADQEMQLSDKVMRRKRKRHGDKPDSSVTEPPPLPSPDTVVLPNQEGFDDYLKTMSEKYALDSGSWD